MAKTIARIRLAKGETGYLDDKSGIFLSWTHPEADVTDDMDCHDLRRSAKLGRIKVIEGTLGQNKSFKQILMEAKARRTGATLKELMGDTPIISDSGFDMIEATEVKAKTSDDTAKATTTVETDIKSAAPKKMAAKMKVAVAETPAPEKVEDAKAETTEEDASEEADEQTKEVVEDMTIRPSTISSLKVGGTRNVKVNQKVTEATVDKKNVADIEITDTGVVVTGKAAGKATVTIKTEKETGTVSVTVK